MKKPDIRELTGVIESLNNEAEIAENEEPFKLVRHSTPLDTLITSPKSDWEYDKTKGDYFIKGEDFIVRTTIKPSLLSVASKKLLLLGLNKYVNDWSKPDVYISLDEYFKINKIDFSIMDTDDSATVASKKSKLRVIKRRIKDDLDKLEEVKLRLESDKDTGHYETFQFVANTAVTRDEYIKMVFISDTFKNHLQISSPTQISLALLSIDGNHRSAFSVGYKLETYYNMRPNILKNKNDIISVRRLLEVTDLQTYEELKGGYEDDNDKMKPNQLRKWEEKVKDPLEDTLDYLVKAGVISYWHYVGAKKTELKGDNCYPKDYKDYLERFYIQFDIPNKEKRKEIKGYEAPKKTEAKRKNKSKANK